MQLFQSDSYIVGKQLHKPAFSNDAFCYTTILLLCIEVIHASRTAAMCSLKANCLIRRLICQPGMLFSVSITMKCTEWVLMITDCIKWYVIVVDARDTAGQERFRTITTAYYRGAMVGSHLHCELYSALLQPVSYLFYITELTCPCYTCSDNNNIC